MQGESLSCLVQQKVLVFGLLLVLGTSCASQSSQSDPEGAKERPVPTAESDPGVNLNVSVGLVSDRIVFWNNSGEAVRNILVVLNEGNQEGGFQHTISIVQPNAMMHFMPRVFANGEGTKLDLSVHKVKTLTVYADVQAGRGRWRGSY